MPYIELSKEQISKYKILIFTEGTILKPKSVFTLLSHKDYIPIGSSVKQIAEWHAQGAEIVYCTSRRRQQAAEIADLLKKYGFSGARLYYRDTRQKYKDIVEEIKPYILIEDNCKSIGGSWQMCITHVDPELKETIKSIVVREFKGIDHLPTNLSNLYDYLDFP